MRELNFQLFLRATGMFVLLFSFGCSQGGFSIGGTADQNSKSGSVGGQFGALDYKGVVASGPDLGTTVIEIDKANGALILVIPLRTNNSIDPSSGPIPSIDGAKFETYRDSKNKAYFALSVPLRYVLKGASSLPVARLPSGDPLPDIAAGELPSVTVPIPGKSTVKLHLYLGVNALGAFVSSPQDPYIPTRFSIRSGLSDIGAIHAIPMNGENFGGFYIATSFPPDIASIIGDYYGLGH